MDSYVSVAVITGFTSEAITITIDRADVKTVSCVINHSPLFDSRELRRGKSWQCATVRVVFFVNSYVFGTLSPETWMKNMCILWLMPNKEAGKTNTWMNFQFVVKESQFNRKLFKWGAITANYHRVINCRCWEFHPEISLDPLSTRFDSIPDRRFSSLSFQHFLWNVERGIPETRTIR